MAITSEDISQAQKNCNSAAWRIKNLYYIINKQGKKELFKPNYAQRKLWNEKWYCNIVLKARQMGFSTLIDLMLLDRVLFNSNMSCGIVCHTIEDSQQLFRRIKFAYENLPEQIRAAIPANTDTSQMLAFKNGSTIRVGTSMRSSTCQYLHISEFGKICNKYPEKAREIVTGSLNTIAAGQYVFIESTAEGRCFDDKTDIYTQRGFVRFDDLNANDVIMTKDENGKCFFVDEWDLNKSWYEGPMHLYQSRSIDTVVTPNHKLWICLQKGKFKFIESNHVVDKKTEIGFEQTISWNGIDIQYFEIESYTHNVGNGKRTIPTCKIPSNLYLKFLGYWLSEGGIIFEYGNKNVYITQKVYPEQMEAVISEICCLLDCSYRYVENRKFVICSAQLAAHLNKIYKPKRIPRNILNLNKTHLRVLHDAIYLGDGDQNKKTQCELNRLDYGRCYPGIDLENDYQELCLRLGYRSTIHHVTSTHSSISHSDQQIGWVNSCRTPVIIKDYVGYTFCVTLQKHHRLFVRRNGKCCWSGNSGYFYEMCKKAQADKESGKELSILDFKFHFYPWYEEPTYRIGSPVTFGEQMHNYFISLEGRGIKLDDEQKWWYAAKEAIQGEDMRREYPSTPQESFEASHEGLYYGKQMSIARAEKRITRVAYDETLQVHTSWDLGYNDQNAIWFFQCLPNKEIHVIDYLEGSCESMSHWISEVLRKPYIYGKHLAPHDISSHEYSTGLSRIVTARKIGINFIPVPRAEIIPGIDAVRLMLPRCWFDETKCIDGIRSLDNYKKEWNEKLGCWASQPYHNQFSHGADAFRNLACGLTYITNTPTLQQQKLNELELLRDDAGLLPGSFLYSKKQAQ